MTTARRLDLLGLSLLVSWLLWIVLASFFTGGAPARVLLMVSVSAIVLAAARRLSEVAPLSVPVIVTSVGLALIVSARDELFSGAPLSAPLGYANANAAFFVQTSIAGLMIWRAGGRRWLKWSGIAAASVFAAVPLLSASKTGAALLFSLFPFSLLVQNKRGSRSAVALCAGCTATVIAATAFLAVTYDADARPLPFLTRVAAAGLTERRLSLWHDGVRIIEEHPLLGVGAGEFPRHAPTAVDPDAHWAHHEFLQHGAEFGVPGVLMMAALLTWAFVRLRMAADQSRFSVLSAVGLASLAVHASMDYILHFPAVPIAAAALVGQE